jgi:hypothetical protein
MQIRVIHGDWGLGIGDWAQSPIPNPHLLAEIQFIFSKNIKLNIRRFLNLN